MVRSRIRKEQALDSDFYLQSEGDTLSGTLNTKIDTTSGTLQTQIDGKPDTLLELTDTPSSYSDSKYLKSTTSGAEWSTVSGVSGGGGLSWTVISGSTTAENGSGYLLNPSAALTLTLPAAPSAGDVVGVVDAYNKSSTYTLTVARNSLNIEGAAEDLVINVDGSGFTLVYCDSTRGWEIVSEIGTNSVTTFDYQNYVDSGDDSAYDFTDADLTLDGTWRDLDLSSKIPSDAVAVQLKVYASESTATGKAVLFRKNGNINSYNYIGLRTQVVSNSIESFGTVACDVNQVIEYYGSSGTWTFVRIQILGWFTEDNQTAVGSGNIYSPTDLTDNALIRGDGGSRNAQTSTVLVSDTGEMTNPSQPSFNAYLTSTLSNVTGDGTTYLVTGAIWTEVFDQGSDFSNGTFTAPVTGRYYFSLFARITGITSSHNKGYIYLTTSNRSYTLWRGNLYNCFDGVYLFVNGSIIADMDQGDSASMGIRVFNGTKVIDLYQTSHFTGALIC